MKKFWKLKTDNDIKQKLKYLNVNNNYIDVILDEYSDFMKYINSKIIHVKYVFISYSDNGNNYIDDFYAWGWGEEIDYDWFIIHDYEYCGIVNLRKNKINKINEVFLENKK